MLGFVSVQLSVFNESWRLVKAGKRFDYVVYIRLKCRLYNYSGDNEAEDPPVPIPNTEVKLCVAESTMWDTAWEDRELPDFKKRSDCFGSHFFFYVTWSRLSSLLKCPVGHWWEDEEGVIKTCLGLASLVFRDERAQRARRERWPSLPLHSLRQARGELPDFKKRNHNQSLWLRFFVQRKPPDSLGVQK